MSYIKTLAASNDRLSSWNIGFTIEVKANRLCLRGMLPPTIFTLLENKVYRLLKYISKTPTRLAEVSLLQSISGKKIETVRQAVLALTKIVGFAPSKKQPLPGVKVLATAIQSFFFIKLGANSIAHSKPLQD